MITFKENCRELILTCHFKILHSGSSRSVGSPEFKQTRLLVFGLVGFWVLFFLLCFTWHWVFFYRAPKQGGVGRKKQKVANDFESEHTETYSKTDGIMKESVCSKGGGRKGKKASLLWGWGAGAWQWQEVLLEECCWGSCSQCHLHRPPRPVFRGLQERRAEAATLCAAACVWLQ